MNCKRCQKHLLAYINRELPPRLQRQVGQHLQQCDVCYQQLQEQQQVIEHLRRDVPLVGRSRNPVPFDQVWAAMQDKPRRPNRLPEIYTYRYGLIALIAVMVFLLPLTMNKRGLALAEPPTPPVPVVQQATPGSTEAIQNEATSVAALLIRLTPEATPQARLNHLRPDAVTTP